jgi:hypothetical protein
MQSVHTRSVPALRAGRTVRPGIFLVFIPLDAVTVLLEGLGKLKKKFDEFIGIRTRDIPAYSREHQSTISVLLPQIFIYTVFCEDTFPVRLLYSQCDISCRQFRQLSNEPKWSVSGNYRSRGCVGDFSMSTLVFMNLFDFLLYRREMKQRLCFA